jgi:hypothetical protein
MSTRRFAHSFHTIGRPPKGKPCDKLKYHYTGALRELVGMLELIAENDPSRFVFPNMPAIIEMCHKYKQPTNKFGERWLRYALAELRARSIISKRLRHLADRRLGWREGFYLMPHDAVCIERNGPCVFQQGFDPSRCAAWWAHQPEWAWPHLQIVESAPGSAPQNAPHSAPQNAGQNAPHSAPRSAPQNAPHHSHQVVEVEKVNHENRSLTVLTVETDQTARAVPSRITTAAGRGNGAGVVVSKPVGKPNPKTIWERELKEFQEGEFEDDQVPPALEFCKPFDSHIPQLIALMEEHGSGDFFARCANWARYRQPPLADITMKNRWALCLEECFGIQPTGGNTR